MKKWILAALIVALATPAFAGEHLGRFQWADPNPAYPVKQMLIEVEIEQVGNYYATNGIAITKFFNGDILGGMCTGTAGVSGSKILMENTCGNDTFSVLLEGGLDGRYVVYDGEGDVKAVGNAVLQ